MRASTRVGLWLLLAGALLGSCQDDGPRRGGLMLMISEDGSLPLDGLEIHIVADDQTLAHNTYRVPQEAPLPATLAIVSNGKEQGTAVISVVGWRESTALDRRDAIVAQIPTDRVAALRIVLSGRCSSLVTTRPGPDGPVAESGCDAGETCDPERGACDDANVDASMLPSYAGGDENTRIDWGAALPGPTKSTGTAGMSTNEAGQGGAGTGGTGGDDAGGAGGGTPREPCDGKCTAPNPVCLDDRCVPCAPNPTPSTCRNEVPQYCDETGHLTSVVSGKCKSIESCEDGTCVCNGLKCGGVCRDPDTDAANCGTCGHVCAVGKCSAGHCTVVPVASGVSEPTYVSVGGGWLYWLSLGSPNKIFNRELSTSETTEMVVQGPSVRLVCDTAPSGVVATSSFVYFASYDVCVKAHGNSATSDKAANMFVTNNGSLGSMAAFGSNVYNINTFDRDLQSSDGSVYRFPSRTVIAVTADERNVYWLEGNSQGAAFVYKHTAPHLDDTAIELAKNQSYSEGIAVYNGNLYWTAAPSAAAGAGSVMRVSTSGGAVTAIASGQTNPSGIAVDASGVYWTNRYANGAVLRVPHAGGTVVELATGQNGAHGIALDATTVYFTNTEGGQVQMVSK